MTLKITQWLDRRDQPAIAKHIEQGFDIVDVDDIHHGHHAVLAVKTIGSEDNMNYGEPIQALTSDRYTVLEEAHNAVADREGNYGTPAENYERAAALATVVLRGKLLAEHEVTAADMVLLMAIAIKGARLINQPDHTDSQVDLAGYASLLSEVC